MTKKDKIKLKDDYAQLMIITALDYDGLTKVKELKCLIDDLVKYATAILNNDDTIAVYTDCEDKKYNIFCKEIKD